MFNFLEEIFSAILFRKEGELDRKGMWKDFPLIVIGMFAIGLIVSPGLVFYTILVGVIIPYISEMIWPDLESKFWFKTIQTLIRAFMACVIVCAIIYIALMIMQNVGNV